MKRLAIAAILFMAAAASGAYLGSWKIDDYLPITANTHQFSTGAAFDAASIVYRIYEDETNVEIVADTAMTKFDTETGFYLDREQLTAATGFEQGKCYTVLIKATVDGVAGIASHTFQIRAEVNAVPIRQEMDTNSTQLAAIVADTNELQTDWTNGGRLDLLVDAIKAMTDLIAIVVTTVDGPNDANEFTITGGQDVNDAYWFNAIMVEDATDGHSEVRWIEEYSTPRSVLVDEPFSFTPAAADKVWILGPVYGGFLDRIYNAIKMGQAPVYPFDRTGKSKSVGGDVTHFLQDGSDP